MRILLYLLLLIVLIFLGSVVFIATQKGDYDIVQSKTIGISKLTAFEYINDYKNWETFNEWKKSDDDMLITYPSKTMGLGASYSWKSTGNNGSMKTIFVKEGDSISQKMYANDFENQVSWKFKDTIGGTKITWRMKGKVGLLTKVKGFFSGGFKNVIEDNMMLSLNNLEKTLSHEIKTYAIKVNGLVQRKETNYFMQTISCKKKSMIRNIKVVLSRMTYFVKKNNINVNGKPFVIYQYNVPNDEIVTFSVCIPTFKEINVMPGSDIQTGKMDAFTCIKTTLKGDYSHLKETWQKAEKYIVDNDYKINFAGKYSEVFSITIDDIKLPSHWKTELYIPVFPKAVPKPAVVSNTVSQPEAAVEPATTAPSENKEVTE